MLDPRESLENALLRLQEVVGDYDDLEQELLDSRREFFGAEPRGDAEAALATRRHLEWFLLERPSEVLEGVPIEVLLDALLERCEGGETDLAQALLQSHAGAFEVTTADQGRGLWVRDLLGAGEHPVQEPDAAAGLRVGDLLVGRVFPIDGGALLLSPAVGCFRSDGLVDAVREDMERLRSSRRGVLRIEQAELERLFFTPSDGSSRPAPEEQADVPPIDLEGERERAREGLREAGVPVAEIEPILREVARSAREGRPVVVEVLNELAMETQADLARARRALVELWAVETHAEECPPAPAPPVRAPGATKDAAHALEAFDAGRAAGQDLESLFRQLADDLGVEPPEDEPDVRLAPDFPGVVGAMVEEYLWDVGREEGEPVAQRHACLRRLSEYGSGLGVFEALGRRELLDFAGRWLLDEGELAGPEEARAVLDALSAFAQWCEERHEHTLWTQAGELLGQLTASVPRLVLARRHTLATSPRDPAGRPYRVASVDGCAVALESREFGDCELNVASTLAELIRPGDLVHVRDAQGTLRISACYPAELFELLERAG